MTDIGLPDELEVAGVEDVLAGGVTNFFFCGAGFFLTRAGSAISSSNYKCSKISRKHHKAL